MNFDHWEGQRMECGACDLALWRRRMRAGRDGTILRSVGMTRRRSFARTLEIRCCRLNSASVCR